MVSSSFYFPLRGYISFIKREPVFLSLWLFVLILCFTPIINNKYLIIIPVIFIIINSISWILDNDYIDNVGFNLFIFSEASLFLILLSSYFYFLIEPSIEITKFLPLNIHLGINLRII